MRYGGAGDGHEPDGVIRKIMLYRRPGRTPVEHPRRMRYREAGFDSSDDD